MMTALIMFFLGMLVCLGLAIWWAYDAMMMDIQPPEGDREENEPPCN